LAADSGSEPQVHQLEAIGGSRPFAFTWHEAGFVPPEPGDYLASVHKRTRRITGSLWRIDSAGPVQALDGIYRRRYRVTRLSRNAWARLAPDSRVQEFTWN
jgi:hypothetical protein